MRYLIVICLLVLSGCESVTCNLRGTVEILVGVPPSTTNEDCVMQNVSREMSKPMFGDEKDNDKNKTPETADTHK